MRAATIFYFLLIALIVAACGSSAQPQVTGKVVETSPVVLPQNTQDTTNPTSQPAVQASTCASSEANKIGEPIAKDYSFTSTEQVMGWFCNGAEFENILVALETADQTGASAEEMLEMLAAGMTWEEIWQVVGLTK
jgi:hypothetical protein